MKSSLFSLITSAFRQLIRLGLRQGVTVQEATQLLKTAFVREAKGEILRLGHTPNVSKVAAMSGLHRREVSKLFDLSEDTKIAESNSLMSRLIGRWLANKKYQSDGKPKSLPIDGKSVSFNTLVKEISQDLNSYTILFELERLKLVRKEGDFVFLNREGFEPRGDSDRALALLSSDIEQLILAVSKNIDHSEDPPNLHITTTYDNINASDLPVIREWIFQQGATFHKKLREFLADYDRDLNPSISKNGPAVKVIVSSFSNSINLEKS